MHVELSAPHGQLTLSSIAGLTFEAGNGDADDFVAFTGHPGDVNAALRDALYRGDPDWNTLNRAPNSITVRVSNSHVGLGGLEPVEVEQEQTLW